MSDVIAPPADATEIISALAAAARGDEPIWMPLAGSLACRRAWKHLDSVGINTLNYGTARARKGDANAPRDARALIACPPDFDCVSPIIVEDLGSAVGARYVELGLQPALADYAGSDFVVGCLSKAFSRLTVIPSLAAAIGRVLRVVHVAVPEDVDFDVSYSDPEVPFSLWVGVAKGWGPISELRLAECVLHETMHLQLSLVEACAPLLEDRGALLPSPWRDEPRPVGGVLHGAYVFAAIREFMMALRDGDSIEAERRHATARIISTKEEIAAALSSLIGCRELTAPGHLLVDTIARSTARTSLPSTWA